jgi:hypothetical protein
MGEVILITGSGNGCPLVLSTSWIFAPNHEVSIGRGDHAILNFDEIDDWVHAQTHTSPPGAKSTTNCIFIVLLSLYPARDGLRSTVTAFSAARLINDA